MSTSITRNIWRSFAFAQSRTFRSSAVSISSPQSLETLCLNRPILSSALDLLNKNETSSAIDIAFAEYKREVEGLDAESVLVSSKVDDERNRPAFSFLSQMMASLGPRHPDTLRAMGMLASVSGPVTPFKLRVIQKRHGGYPVRLNNGKWAWQGPHWSRHNNRTWKTGYSSDFTYGRGK
jgi:hypothetical protein